MAYTKQTWNNGDVITAEKLNHIEDGIGSSDVCAVHISATINSVSGTLKLFDLNITEDDVNELASKILSGSRPLIYVEYALPGQAENYKTIETFSDYSFMSQKDGDNTYYSINSTKFVSITDGAQAGIIIKTAKLLLETGADNYFKTYFKLEDITIK